MKQNLLFGLLLSCTLAFGMDGDWQDRLTQVAIPDFADGAYSIFADSDYETFKSRASNLGFTIIWHKSGNPDFTRAISCQDWGSQKGVDLSGPEFEKYHAKQMKDSVEFWAENKTWHYLVTIEKQENKVAFVRARKFAVEQNK